MDLYQIRYFLAVAETGSFTKAAERVFVTQPTLSAGIRKLEDGLGTPLFIRRARRVELTEAGQRFQPHARVILQEAAIAEQAARRGADRQGFRLGVLKTLPVERIAALLTQFADGQRDVDVDLFEGTVPEIDEALTAGRIDAAITRIADDADRAQAAPLFRDRYRIAVSERNPLARRSQLRIPELDGLPFILRRHCELMGDIRRNFLAGGARPRIVHRSTQDEWTVALVAADLGLALMPQSFERPGIAMIPIVDYEPTRLIGLAWHGAPDEATTLFRAFAASHDWHAGSTSPVPQVAAGWMR
ncbi:LysR family transcriptional regulator [Tistrella mobilis]|uniref:LysR family transcriptional regulator n=1 Tax=Tistrella mobilis TaxID=171437 RepID=UPI003555F9E5